MATRRYNIPLGKTMPVDITEAVGSAITSGLLQVTVDLAVTATKRQVIEALEAVKRYIKADVWPPA